MKRLVTELWRGELPLWKTFWEYALLYGILLNAVATFASLALFSAGESAIGLAAHLVPLPYDLLTLVAVWRSAGRYAGPPALAAAARVAIAVVFPLEILL